MPTPFLLAQTSRAGKENHRLLVSGGAPLNDLQAIRLIVRAVQDAGEDGTAAGTDFFAVCQGRVFQASGDRFGKEVLLLGDIDTTAFDEQQRTAVFGRLRNLFTELNSLVDRTDWVHTDGMLVVPEDDALGRWLVRAFPLLASRSRSPAWGTWLLEVGLVLGLVLLVGAALGRLGFLSPGPDSKPPRKDKTNENERLIEQYLKERKLSKKEDQVIRELAVLAGKKPTQREVILGDPKVRSMLKRPHETEPYYFIQPLLDQSSSLKVLSGDSPDPDKVLQVRIKLIRVGLPCRAFREEMAKLSEDRPDPRVHIRRELVDNL